ncbi:hypothetical protein DRQ17_05095 [bacterium]|nr:MAG: hypothetical protein DRQ17_05095 [bacterium]RKZ21503.1 MAG: hypothetical protein DRQ23_06985 [bacterium]
MRFLSLFLNTFLVLPFLIFSTVKDCTLVDIEMKKKGVNPYHVNWKKEPVVVIVDTLDMENVSIINITNPNGRVDIEKSDDGKVKVEYKIFKRYGRVDTTGLIEKRYSDGRIFINVKRRKYVSVDIELLAPSPDTILVEGVNNQIRIDCDIEDMEISTVNAKVDFTGNGKQMDIDIVNGVVNLDSDCGSMGVDLVDGKVSGEVQVKDSMHVNLVNGSVKLGIKGEDYKIHAKTNSGTIKLEGFKNPDVSRRFSSMEVNVSTGDGEIPMEILVTNGVIELERR